MLEAATKVLRFVQEDFMDTLDEIASCNMDEMQAIEDVKACVDNLDWAHMQLRDLLRDTAFALDFRRMEGLHGVDSLSPPADTTALDMTPSLIAGVPCYNRKQFAQATGVTPQRVSQLLNYNHQLLRMSCKGHLYIPVGELARRHEWGGEYKKGKKSTRKPSETPDA